MTPERILAILRSPDAKESVKDMLTYHVGRLYETTAADTLPEGPELTALEYEEAAYIYRPREKKGTLDDAEREAFAKLAAYVERHEPKDARLRAAPLRSPPQADARAARHHPDGRQRPA